MLRRVRHDVVDVVVTFPPAQGKPTKEVRNEDSNTAVDVEIMRDAHVTRVMGSEDELVPRGA